MSRFGVEYRVGRPTGVCAATGRGLSPGEPCMASLWESPGQEGFERRDYSIEAWEASGAPQGVFGYWRTVVPDPDSRPRILVDDAMLLDLFESLAGDTQRTRVVYRFVLCLILMRRRVLKYAGRKVEGESERWLVVSRGAAEQGPIEVVNPRLADEDICDLNDRLGEILCGAL